MIIVAQLIVLFVQALNDAWGYIWGTAGIQWTKAKQQQKVDYMVNKYGTGWKNNSEAKSDNYYMAAMYGSKWVGHYVADCSGLFAWAFKKLGGAIAHGSNSIWDRYCSSKGELRNGKRTDGKDLKPGTAVFTYNKQKDNRGHIGLYVGDGWVIEAQGTKAGVVRSSVTLEKWVEWGELKGVDYGSADSPVTVPVQKDENQGFPTDIKWHSTIRRGSKGQDVIDCQTMLYRLGYGLGVQGIDGDFGKNTEQAVKNFQSDHRASDGTVVDGVVGPMTWAALEKAVAQLDAKPVEHTYTVCIHGLDKTQADAMKNKYPGCVVTEE